MFSIIHVLEYRFVSPTNSPCNYTHCRIPASPYTFVIFPVWKTVTDASLIDSFPLS
jgi:hypothetical protein